MAILVVKRTHQTIKGDPLNASLSDRVANIYGRNQADFYVADQF